MQIYKVLQFLSTNKEKKKKTVLIINKNVNKNVEMRIIKWEILKW